MRAWKFWECPDDGCWSSSPHTGAKKSIEMENGWPIGRRMRARLLQQPDWGRLHSDRVSAISWRSLAGQFTLAHHRRPRGSCDDHRADGFLVRRAAAQDSLHVIELLD